jgi:chemotaxis-related protein WspB
MLALTLGVGASRYAVDARSVVEVVPRIALQPVPHASESVAGVLDHGGKVVPVVDLGVLLGSQPCQLHLSTRIVLVHAAAGYRDGLMGMIAERVTELRDIPEDAGAPTTLATPNARYLGPIVSVEDGLIQVLRVEAIAATIIIGRQPDEVRSVP